MSLVFNLLSNVVCRFTILDIGRLLLKLMVEALRVDTLIVGFKLIQPLKTLILSLPCKVFNEPPPLTLAFTSTDIKLSTIEI